MNLNELPNTILYEISKYISLESPYHNKVDIFKDSIILKLACCLELSKYVNEYIDPTSKDGKISENVLKNLRLEKNKWIDEKQVEDWGLCKLDLQHVYFKTLETKKKVVNFYKLQDIKMLSAKKYAYDYTKIHTNPIQLNRLLKLEESFKKISSHLRFDSTKCCLYIKTGKGNPDDIAIVLKEMEFYHTFTDYKKYFIKFMIEYDTIYGYYSRNDISYDAKKMALNKFVIACPEKRHIMPHSLQRFL